MGKSQAEAKKSQPTTSQNRNYVSQEDVPSCSLDQALRIGRALVEQYAAKPATPLHIASAIDMSPNSGPFRTLCGASIAYGITVGGCNAKEISLSALGKRILQPLSE